MPALSENSTAVPVSKAKGHKGASAASFFRVPQGALTVPVPFELECFAQLAPGMGNRSRFVQILLSSSPAKRDLLLYVQMSYGLDNLSVLINYIKAQADLCIQYGIQHGVDSSLRTGSALEDKIRSLVNRACLLELSQFIALPRVALVPITGLTEEEKLLFLLATIGATQDTQKQIIQWQVAHLRSGTSVADVMLMLGRLYTKHLLPLANEYQLSQTGVHSFYEAMQDCATSELSKLVVPPDYSDLFELEIFSANLIFRCDDENKRKMMILANLDRLVSHCGKFNYQDIDPRMDGFRSLFCYVLCLAGQDQKQNIINQQTGRSACALIQRLSNVLNEKRLDCDVDITLAALRGKISASSGAAKSTGTVKSVAASDIVPAIMQRYDGSRLRGKWKTFSGKDKTFSRSDKEDVLQEMLVHVDKCRPVAYSSNPVVRFFGTTGNSTRRALIAALPNGQQAGMESRFKQGAVSIDDYKSAFSGAPRSR